MTCKKMHQYQNIYSIISCKLLANRRKIKLFVFVFVFVFSYIGTTYMHSYNLLALVVPELLHLKDCGLTASLPH